MNIRPPRVQVELDEETHRRFKMLCASFKPRLSMRVVSAMMIGQLVSNAHKLTNSQEYSANEQMTLAFDDFSGKFGTIQKQRRICPDAYSYR
jgi:hypothetical protein